MKFNHMTYFTNHIHVQDSEKIFVSNETKGMMYNLFAKIMCANNELVHIMDNVYAKGIMADDIYAITLLYDKDIIILETMGAVSESGKDALKGVLSELNKTIFKREFHIKEVEIPVVYDYIFPNMQLPEEIFQWTGDFCRCMGAIAFEIMQEKFGVKND
ncbi:MAG: hypothetical protein IJX99_00265 [Clostridia bacterium]|nr:hypothetical protein [Clostridia bacterium]